MSLRSAATVTSGSLNVKYPYLEVRIDGRRVADVFEATVSLGFDQSNSQTTLFVKERPSWLEENKVVEIVAGYWTSSAKTGTDSQQIFKGELTGLSWEYFPGRIGIDARGKLRRARFEWKGSDLSYANTTDKAIIEDLLTRCGVTEYRIELSELGTLGAVDPVVLVTGDEPWSLIETLDELAGYKTYETGDGVVVRRRISGIPAPGGVWHFQEGVDIIRIKRNRSTDGIFNGCMVYGLIYEGSTAIGSAFASNSYIPSPPGTITKSITSNIVESAALAGSIAQRFVGDFNRRPEGMELETIGNALIQPGMTVTVTSDEVEAAGVSVLVQSLTHRISASSFTTTLTTTGGNLSNYNASAPYAIFDINIFKEGQDTGGGTVASLAVVVADGGMSFDPDGPETNLTYRWTVGITGGAATIYGGTVSPVLRFSSPGTATSGTITLVVTDEDSLSGTASATFNISGGTFLYEDLWTAEGTVIAMSSNGQQTWKTATTPGSGSATCLAPFAADWGEIFGAHNGTVYADVEKLRNGTVSSFGAPFGGTAVTAVSIHELATQRLWAGAADGRVAYAEYDSTNGTVSSWTIKGTAPASPINDIRESYAAFGEVRVTAGTALYISYDDATSWATVVTPGGTARWMAAGWGQNVVSATGTADAIRKEDGGTVVHSPSVTGARGVAFGWRVQEAYSASDAGSARLFRSDGSFGTLSVVGTVSSYVNHMIRSGNEDGIVYLACGNGTDNNAGLYKTFRNESPVRIRDTGTRRVWMAGYGAAHGPETFALYELLRGTAGVNPGGIYHWVNGTWTLRNSGLPTASWWWWLAVDTADPNKWAILGNNTNNSTSPYAQSGNRLYMELSTTSALWYTTDKGLTWAAVAVANLSGSGDVTVYSVEWQNGTLYVCGSRGARHAFLWRGTPGTTLSLIEDYHPATDDGFSDFRYMTPGVSGDLILAEWDSPGGGTFGRQAKVTQAGIVFTQIGTGFNDAGLVIDSIPTTVTSPTRVIVGIDQTAVAGEWATQDYNSVAFRERLSSVTGRWIGATIDGVYIGGRTASGAGTGGVAKVSDPLGNPSASVVTGDNVDTGHLRSAKQARTSRSAVACNKDPVSSTDIYVWDGLAWKTIAGPGSTLTDRVEILLREATDS